MGGPRGGGCGTGGWLVEAVGDEASAAEKRRMAARCFGAAGVVRQSSTQGGQGRSRMALRWLGCGGLRRHYSGASGGAEQRCGRC
jgi:hypothetical protein